MKKNVKKLRLAKETVRNLSFGRGQVVGGAYTDNYSDNCTATTNTCPYTAANTCASASCGWTCMCQSNQVACPGTFNSCRC